MLLPITATVEEYMLEKLCLRGLNAGEFERALEFAKRELDERVSNTVRLPVKQGEGVLVKDCWRTLATNYTQESLDMLWHSIERHAFTWCINMLHSLL